jgi:hypothetical protein
MAKDYIKGASYNLYLNTGSYGTPTWTLIKAATDIDVASNPDDVEVEERGMDMGHLQGEDDPAITFGLNEDAGDSNVETLIAALYSGAMKEIAVARGLIATSGVKYWRLEACLMGVNLSAPRGSVAAYDVEARRHANSDYAMTRNTAA